VLAVAAFIVIANSLSADPAAGPAVATSGKVRGLATAPVTIEEYADFQCPACAQFARTTEARIVADYVAAGKVRIVYHHFAFLGMESSWAAEASECAAEQGRFWDFHDRLFAAQAGENRGAFSKANLKAIGSQLGLGTSFAACVDSGRYAQAVRDETQRGSQAGIRATPTLIVDGQRIQGAATYDQLKAIIDAALAR
jgi:protein-disulfide isomerase